MVEAGRRGGSVGRGVGRGWRRGLAMGRGWGLLREGVDLGRAVRGKGTEKERGKDFCGGFRGER